MIESILILFVGIFFFVPVIFALILAFGHGWYMMLILIREVWRGWKWEGQKK